ncbi:EIN2-like protein [Selaginella moellendorffii]|uniref:EIN2-like protein n=1 Tax=Selaginella moellendorffii TaxID=88036 RepID=D8SWP5_SELML|nr:ethylene-insensitive protein 2 [Selaginella moellendorffii]EFJ11132.1 EIN2-like protein [Selaginella moellendorffii]|eukprot:XP_002987829.1 ethylene-insensitive protein 2 [Selaginella moellendorffii]
MRIGVPSGSYISLLAPALLVSIGSIDPGNWATSIEGGSRFGYELVWVVFLANLIALLLRSLATHLNLVSGKHLAQACHDEYPSGVCLLLLFLSELSLVVLDSAMVLSSAVGLNMVLGLPVLVGALLVALDVFFLMGFVPFLGPGKAEVILGVIVLSMVLVFVLNAFVSRPPVVPILGGLWPRLKSDSLYAVVGLLGANIMPHNLYLNSALGQEQRKADRICCAPTILDFILTAGMPAAINLAVMVVAASTFHSAGFAVLTLQDGCVVMEQALSRSVAPLAFGSALLAAGVFSTLTGTLVSQVASEGLLGKRIDAWRHRLVMRAAAVTIAVFCAWSYGNEGIYQLLVLSQVILALQLPFTLVPLIRLTSSAAYMGKNKISSLWEVLAWSVLAFVISLNLCLVFSTLFSQSEEFGGSTNWEFVAGSDSNSLTVPVALTVVTAAVGFLVWLIFAPIRSDTPAFAVEEKDGQPMDKEKDLVYYIPLDGNSSRSSDVGTVEDIINTERAELISESEVGTVTVVESEADECLPVLQQSEVDASHLSDSVREDTGEEEASITATSNSSDVGTEECPSSRVDHHHIDHHIEPEPTSVPTNDNVPYSSGETSAVASSEIGGLDKDAISLEKDEEEAESWENLEQDCAVMSSALSLTYEGIESVISTRKESSDGCSHGSESGSLSRLSGLGRASRRQFAATLDEFWGRLFDLHGQPVRSDSVIKPSVSQNSRTTHSDNGPFAAPRQAAKRDYKSCFSGSVDPFGRVHSNLAASTSSQSPSNRWCFDYKSGYSGGDQRYSSLRSFAAHEDLDCQPATIHGYNIASYTRPGSVEQQSSARARSSLHLDVASRTGGCLSQVPASYYAKANFDQSDTMTRVFQPTQDMFSASKGGQRGVDDTSSWLPRSTDYEQWSSFSNNSVDKWNPLVYRATGELDKSLLSHPIGRSENSERTTLSFDDISPSQTHRDGFSIQAAAQQTESLWSRPVEHLFGAPGEQKSVATTNNANNNTKAFRLSTGVEFGLDTLEQLRLCVRKLLQQEGSEWLFQIDNGCDEDVIAGVAAREKSLLDLSEPGEAASVYSNGTSIWSVNKVVVPGVPHCGDSCVWGSGLLVSFGVWCVHRVLELALMESRPELWGKYTYVLNRLQGILDPAFLSPRTVLPPCICLQGYQLVGRRNDAAGWSSYPFPWPWGRNTSNPSGKAASGNLYLDMIKEVETAVGARKGRTGTAAGDVAFPKGKENLASVLKRYKRRLGNHKSGSCNRR